MMSPITERLRSCRAAFVLPSVERLMSEAAAEIDALRLALAEAEERAKKAESLQGERGRCLRIAAFYERHNGDDDAWEMCAQYIANDIRGGQEPLTDEECVAKIYADASKVTTLEARCAELEKKIDIDEKRFTLAWDALDAAITYLRKEETCNHQLISYLNSAKHGISGRSAIAPAPGEGEPI